MTTRVTYRPRSRTLQTPTRMVAPTRPRLDEESERDHSQARVTRVLAGDHSAFSEIYVAYSPKVHGFISRRVGRLAEVDDLTQETFVQLYRSLAAYEGRSSLLTWTFGIANNVCRRYFRQCSRWMIGPRETRALDEYGVDGAIERRIDAARVLDRCHERLATSRRPAHRRIFQLRYGESQSIRAIAENVGKSSDAVKVSLRRSRAALVGSIPDVEQLLREIDRIA